MAVRLQIKEIAQGQNLSQGKLIEKSGVTPQLMNRYWNNHIDGIKFDPLERIAKALGVAPGSLLVSDADPIPEIKDEIATTEQ